jgi:hypothetical protein
MVMQMQKFTKYARQLNSSADSVDSFNNEKQILDVNFESDLNVISDNDDSSSMVTASITYEYENINYDKNITDSSSKNFLKDEFNRETEKKRKFINDFTSTFLRTIKDDILEDGMISKTDLVCEKYYEQNSNYFLQGINELFNKNFTDSKIIVFILSALAKMKYSNVVPNGETMVMTAINHVDIEVKDYALKAIDAWEAGNLLKNLEKLEITCDWMRGYIEELRKDLIK